MDAITHAKIFGDFGAPKRVKCVRTKLERTPKNKTVNIIEQNEKEVFMDGCNENVIEFMTNDTRATLSFSQGRYKSAIRKLAAKHPEDCQISADTRTEAFVLMFQYPGFGFLRQGSIQRNSGSRWGND